MNLSHATRLIRIADLEAQIIGQAHVLGAAITAATDACLAESAAYPELQSQENMAVGAMRVLCLRLHDVCKNS